MIDGNADRESNATPAGSTVSPVSRNRLSIAHLLLWTATTALAIGTIMPDPVDAPFDADTPAQVRTYLIRQQQEWRVVTVVTGPVLGAGLAGLAIAAWRAWRRHPGFPTQPGHWILMIIGMTTVALMDLRLLDRLDRLRSMPIFIPLTILYWPASMLTLILLVGAYVHVAEPLRWRRVFIIAGASAGLLMLGGCCGLPLGPQPAQIIILAILYATPISMVVATVLDIRSGQTYDVFHWVGAIAVPALAIILSGLAFLG